MLAKTDLHSGSMGLKGLDMQYLGLSVRKQTWLLTTIVALASLCSAATKLIVSPANPMQLSNSNVQFTATLNDRDVTKTVQWSSSNPGVAIISSTGIATLLSAGTSTITALARTTTKWPTASTTLTVTTAMSPVFSAQPTDTNVSAVIDATGGVKIQMLDNLGDPLPNQNLIMSVGTNPPGTGTLSGTLMQTTDATGTATFPDLKIDWLGTGYTLVASASPSSGPVSGTSAAFNELRVGHACLGPDMPACSSGCADTDLDGLNDAWENAGGVDLNGDGLITDSVHDVLLPGANPNAPDLYLKYDYMVAPTHDHKPPDKAWDQMKAMFAAHGITLHVLAPASGIPEHQVTTLDPNSQASCAGDDFITMQQLRKENFGNLQPAYHYMVFAHDSTTPNDASLAMNCPNDALCGSKPAAGASGIADLLGDDAIISFGFEVDNGQQVGVELSTSTMMHELGHNFGLVHGSLADPGNAPQECMNYKPNYISVMNYTYQLFILTPATAPGAVTPIRCSADADCGPPNISGGRCATANSCFCTDDLQNYGGNICYRPDYAEDTLLNLNETTLNENVGVGGPSSLEDIVLYFVEHPTLAIVPGPSDGEPIDWNNDGSIADLTGCYWTGTCPDINGDGSSSDQLDTTADWTQVNGQFIHFNFQFQCTPGYQNDVAGSKGSRERKLRYPRNPAAPRTQIITQE